MVTEGQHIKSKDSPNVACCMDRMINEKLFAKHFNSLGRIIPLEWGRGKKLVSTISILCFPAKDFEEGTYKSSELLQRVTVKHRLKVQGAK